MLGNNIIDTTTMSAGRSSVGGGGVATATSSSKSTGASASVGAVSLASGLGASQTLASPSPLSGSICEDSDFPVRRRRRKVRDLKAWCMPFFKKFWANLGHGAVKQSLKSELYGTPVEEVDPFVFEEVS